jgi:hypothetical protein
MVGDGWVTLGRHRLVREVKSAEKARAEAPTNAGRDLWERAAKAERDRVAAEERVVQDRKMAAERAAAAAKVMADLGAAVGGIVKAAMAGDFSQRVSLEGKQGTLYNLAVSMNTMCDSEQSGGIDQFNKALSQMDQVTQQNSALVEELPSRCVWVRRRAE